MAIARTEPRPAECAVEHLFDSIGVEQLSGED